MQFETERINLRKYNDDDFDFLYSLLSNGEMVRHIGEGKTKDRKEAQNFLEWIYRTYQAGADRGLMVLERKDDHTPIGHAGLVPQFIDGVEELEIGYWVSRSHWGKGYATEAAKALKVHGLDHLGEDRLISLIQPNNIASKRVAGKIGMDFEKEVVSGGRRVEVYSICKPLEVEIWNSYQ
ncbi:GNAT family N-acetyltransferase [Halobacillus yeomjeoni]|uniref:GNAT family N-acetyltransferase n=1 Tax=Halobacillus yeomjeoni TaxID=311194 RepID=UPI001CD3A84E|nr:GNAT family N-acetyltransferase [Halobacillus yeomjeoni]MCA0983510.1 GNAT family N-acetyltransferase [Halobacillus yeomjeoni]